MSAPNFSFPPPPPPPPKAAFSPHQGYSQPGYPQTNGLGGRGGRPARGRGRGDGHRGSRGGMFRGHGNPPSSSAGPRDGGYMGLQSSGYPAQLSANPTNPYPLPEYPQRQQSQYHSQRNEFPRYQQLGNYPQPAAYGAVQPSTNHPYSSSLSPPSYQNAYPAQPYGLPHTPSQPPVNQPTIVGPPIRMGFDHDQSRGYCSNPAQAYVYGQPDVIDMRTGPDLRYYDHGPSHRPRNSNMQNLNRHNPSNYFSNNRSEGAKRGSSTAFQRSSNSIVRPQVAPAVPSFGIPLPSKPPAPSDNGKKPRKKKRKHNQLGLTPKADEHESSEEEEDVDEEAKLAAAVGAGSSDQKQLQFTYRGHTATLRTPADIAAWIEERKSRYPTKARVQEASERKQLFQEAQKATTEALKQKQEKRKSEVRERKKQEKAAEERKDKEEAKLDPRDAALKAKMKAEKLRRRLVKEEKRVAKAEAKAEEARIRAEATQIGPSSPQSLAAGTKRKRDEPEYPDGDTQNASNIHVSAVNGVQNGLPNGTNEQEQDPEEITTAQKNEQSSVSNKEPAVSLEDMIAAASTTISEPDIEGLQPSLAVPNYVSVPVEACAGAVTAPNGEVPPKECMAETESDSDDTMSISSSSPEPSSDDDDTSSDGSISGGDAPAEASSKRAGPERVPPPKRVKPKSICRQFLRSGHCKRGDRCDFLHELPERGSSRAVPEEGRKLVRRGNEKSKSNRKSLYSRLVEQEKDKEDEQVLQAIIYLGQSGVLNPPPDMADTTATRAENGVEGA